MNNYVKIKLHVLMSLKKSTEVLYLIQKSQKLLTNQVILTHLGISRPF